MSGVVFGGYSLEDHWNRRDALDSIALGGWDYVVMQQGPSSLPENRLHLIEWSTRFAERIRDVGSRPALYMVWPSNRDFDGVSRAYTDATRSAGGRLIPAGEAFRTVMRSHRGIEIFESDGFHPSPAGSYLAALVIYGRLAGSSVRGMTLDGRVPGLTAAQAAQLQAAADEAIRVFGID